MIDSVRLLRAGAQKDLEPTPSFHAISTQTTSDATALIKMADIEPKKLGPYIKHIPFLREGLALIKEEIFEITGDEGRFESLRVIPTVRRIINEQLSFARELTYKFPNNGRKNTFDDSAESLLRDLGVTSDFIKDNFAGLFSSENVTLRTEQTFEDRHKLPSREEVANNCNLHELRWFLLDESIDEYYLAMKARTILDYQVRTVEAELRKIESSLFNRKHRRDVVTSWLKRYERERSMVDTFLENFSFYKKLTELSDRQSELSIALSKAEIKLRRKEDEISKHALAYEKANRFDAAQRGAIAITKKQIRLTKLCPYCGESIGKNPHLDHIQPVASGGLSIVKNLVYVCGRCNLRKGDKGLLEFLIDSGFDVQAAYHRLKKLGKQI